jgi:hypothetical protein
MQKQVMLMHLLLVTPKLPQLAVLELHDSHDWSLDVMMIAGMGCNMFLSCVWIRP